MKSGINIDLMLTHACNFRCKYCYEKDTPYVSDINPKVVKQVPSFVSSLHKQYKCPITISFWGGEPTLKSDIIISLTNKLKNRDYISFNTITNAYDLSLLKDFLIDINQNYPNKFHIQVSYDFEPNQSINRVEAVSGRGDVAQKKVLDNIYWLAKNQIRFAIKSTIDVQTLPNVDKVYFDYLKVYKKIKKLNKSLDSGLKITIDTHSNFTEKECLDILEPFKEAMKNILKYQVYNKKEALSFNFFEPEKALCSVGNNIIAVDIDGLLYCCHGAIFNKNKQDHNLGSIFDYSINNLFIDDVYGNDTSKVINKECQECGSCFCLRCNTHCYDKSKKKTYEEKMIDFAVNKNYCFLHKEISKFIYAKYQLLKNKV